MCDPERLAARREEGEVRARARQLGKLGRAVEDMLEVVETSSSSRAPTCSASSSSTFSASAIVGNTCAGSLIVASGTNVTPSSKDSTSSDAASDGEARLADPARAGQRDEADALGGQEPDEVGDLPLAADELHGLDRHASAIEAAERREFGSTELEQPHPARDVLRPVLAKAPELEVAVEQRRVDSESTTWPP